MPKSDATVLVNTRRRALWKGKRRVAGHLYGRRDHIVKKENRNRPDKTTLRKHNRDSTQYRIGGEPWVSGAKPLRFRPAAQRCSRRPRSSPLNLLPASVLQGLCLGLPAVSRSGPGPSCCAAPAIGFLNFCYQPATGRSQHHHTTNCPSTPTPLTCPRSMASRRPTASLSRRMAMAPTHSSSTTATASSTGPRRPSTRPWP